MRTAKEIIKTSRRSLRTLLQALANRVISLGQTWPGGRFRYPLAVLAVALVGSAAGAFFDKRQLADVAMLHLLAIGIVALRFGLGPSVLAAAAAVASFDFFFIPPYLTFEVADFSHLVTFVVMFLVALVISGLMQLVRSQAEASAERERRTAALNSLLQELSQAEGLEKMLEVATRHLEKTFASKVEFGVAPELPGYPEARALCLPLRSGKRAFGVLRLDPEDPAHFEDPERRQLAATFAAQIAVLFEKAELASETERVRLEVKSEQHRSALLSSVSHDLRTPLAVIQGAASALVEQGSELGEAASVELLSSIANEAERLNRLIGNLLDMTRLESGAVPVKREWLALEEVVGAALTRMESRLSALDIRVDLPSDTTLVALDGVLIEQVLINLLENAAKYAPGVVEIKARVLNGQVEFVVRDHGPGVTPGQEQLIFEKFRRSSARVGAAGFGLGLSICRAIVLAHGGQIGVENCAPSGASFRFVLPIGTDKPELGALEAVEDPLPSAPPARSEGAHS